MILPIVAYGDPVLKKVANAIAADHPNLESLIENMLKNDFLVTVTIRFQVSIIQWKSALTT